MVQLKKYRAAKVPTWIITLTDSEGMHRQLIITDEEIKELVSEYEYREYCKTLKELRKNDT